MSLISNDDLQLDKAILCSYEDAGYRASDLAKVGKTRDRYRTLLIISCLDDVSSQLETSRRTCTYCSSLGTGYCWKALGQKTTCVALPSTAMETKRMTQTRLYRGNYLRSPFRLRLAARLSRGRHSAQCAPTSPRGCMGVRSFYISRWDSLNRGFEQDTMNVR